MSIRVLAVEVSGRVGGTGSWSKLCCNLREIQPIILISKANKQLIWKHMTHEFILVKQRGIMGSVILS